MDIRLTDDFDYQIINGDFAYTANDDDLDVQTTNLLLTISQGGIKYEPLSGIGIGRIINDILSPESIIEIDSQLKDNGVPVNLVYTNSEGRIQID